MNELEITYNPDSELWECTREGVKYIGSTPSSVAQQMNILTTNPTSSPLFDGADWITPN